MMRRPTTTGELRRLREFAAAGMTAHAATVALRRFPGFAAYWAPRCGIVFLRRRRKVRPSRPSVHPAEIDLAAARVRQTMDRLRAYQRMGANA